MYISHQYGYPLGIRSLTQQFSQDVHPLELTTKTLQIGPSSGNVKGSFEYPAFVVGHKIPVSICLSVLENRPELQI